MCFGGGGGSVQQDTTLQQRQVALSRQMEADYQKRFLPYERQLVNQAIDKTRITDAVNQSKAAATKAFDASKGQSQRQLAGFGVNLTADQQRALTNSHQRDRNFSSMSATGNARQQTANRYGQLQSSMMALGRQAQNQGLDSMNQAAGMENQRNIQNQQNAAQNSAGNIGFMGQVVGMGIGAAIASDKNKKKNIQPRSDQQDMNDARSFANYEYDYKKGQSGGRAEYGHVGGMAQEMPPSMSDGQQVDLGDATMVAFGAIRDIDKRLQQLEGRA